MCTERFVPAFRVICSADRVVLLAKYCRPKLTTLRYPIEMMATHAAKLALDCAKGEFPEPGTTFKYTPTIVKRDSVSRVK